MASESAGQKAQREEGHKNHFRLLQEGMSWSGREPNTLFQNRGDGTFDEVGNVLGTYLRLDSRGAAVGDLDGDGDLDLAVYNRNNPTLKIYRNDAPVQGNVALVDLQGVEGEPLATGAQAFVTCGGKTQLRQVEAGSGFLSQSASTLHFGLGGCTEISAIEVRWPRGSGDPASGDPGSGGRVERWSRLPVNHRLTLTQGSTEVATAPLLPRNYNRNQLAPASGEYSARRPELAFSRLDGGTLELAELDRSTVVLNFWATWCTACLAEMPDLESLAREFVPKGVRFIGVGMDEGRPVAAVKAFLAQRGVSYEQVWGELPQHQPFAALAGSPPGAIPTTVVLHRGTVKDVVVGKIERQRLADLLARLASAGSAAKAKR